MENPYDYLDEEAFVSNSMSNADAEYEMYCAEENKARQAGEEYFDMFVKPFDKLGFINKDLWLSAFIAGWFKTNYTWGK